MINMDPVYSMSGQSFMIVKNDIVTEISRTFIDMTGYTIEELLNRNIKDVFRILRVCPGINIENIGERVDYFLFTKSHEVRFVNIEALKETGGRERFYAIKEKPGPRLEDRYNYLCQLCSENVCGVAIYSVPDFILIKANHMYLEFLDAPYNNPENSLGSAISEIITGWEGSSAQSMWNNIVAEGKPKHINEYESGSFLRGVIYRDMTFIPLYEDGVIKYITVNANEVTGRVIYRKQLEEKNRIIEQQQKEFDAVLDNMVDGLTIIDERGNYIKVNNTVKKWLDGQLISKIGDSLAPDKFYDISGKALTREEVPAQRILKGEKVNQQDILMKTKNGEERYISFSGTPIYDNKGNFIIGVVNTRDTTERVQYLKLLEHQKEMQEQLLKSEQEKNEALEKVIDMKDEFLSLISHEFRTPLNVINTAIQAMNFIYADELPNKVKEYLKIIRQNTFRQLRLVNNLLDITRANAGRIKVNKKNVDIVFLTKAITESVYQYASQKGVRITFLSSLEKKIMGIDDEKYERVILNLLSNAIKFTPEGKIIVVSLHRVKGNICVKVRDNGIGIPRDKTDLIFERFGQVDSLLSRQAEGTGIGLSLVKKFVEALGGSIFVESKVGKGSTFTILLPDEEAAEVHGQRPVSDFVDNHLVQITNVEFSDIYL